MTNQSRRKWTKAGILTSMVIPAAFAVMPGIRKRYHLGLFSIPSLAMLGGLWLWERHAQRHAH